MTNTYFPSKTSITVDDQGRLLIKTYGGEPLTVCRADVVDFVDAITNLRLDIIAMSSAADTKED